MQEYNTIIGNLFNSIDRRAFKRLTEKHKSDKYFKHFNTWVHFVVIFLGQILKNCNSLRDIEDFLMVNQNEWYHLNIKAQPVRSTISYANNKRDWLVFYDLFNYLYLKRKNKACFEENPIKIIDSTPIYLNLNLFEWADENLRIKGTKVHVVYDLNAKNPVHFTFSSPRINDIEEAKKLEIEPNTTYVFDRGYMDFNWWSDIDDKGSIVITRLKINNAIVPLTEIQYHYNGISSQLIQLKTKRFKDGRFNKFSEKVLRRIFSKREDGSQWILVTNDLNRSAEEIVELYQQRWQIELFFKWIKQNLKIKNFLGRSENAVKTQICIAMIAYLIIQDAVELKDIMSEMCKYFSESKFIKMINNDIFRTLKPKRYGRKQKNRYPPWQLRLDFQY